MKHLICFSAVLLIFVSCNRMPKEERVLVATELDAITVFNIPKAACKNCQAVIEGGLENADGVKQSILNLHTKELSIVYQPDLISSEVLEKKVKSLEGQIPCK